LGLDKFELMCYNWKSWRVKLFDKYRNYSLYNPCFWDGTWSGEYPLRSRFSPQLRD